jgi:uncharacterized protein (DUF924 family)
MSATDTRSSPEQVEPAWVDEVLHYWFNALGETQWFARSAVVDAHIRERFLSLHEWLVTNGCAEVTAARSILAGVIVLDQFSRNMFRDTARAYAADSIARRLASAAISQGFDLAMADRERLFLYLPFEHSENREDQALSVRLFEKLGEPDWTHYALAHKAIIDRFGRFPHRNATLNRQSSADEIALLNEPMGSF